MKVLMFILIAVLVSAQDNLVLEDTAWITNDPIDVTLPGRVISPGDSLEWFLFPDSIPAWIIYPEPYYHDFDMEKFTTAFDLQPILNRLDSLDKRIKALENALFNIPKSNNPRTIIMIED